MDSQCAVCHKKNDQLLMLSCGHDPCIDCAASHYFAGAQFRREFQLIKQANYWCQVCFQPTTIDKTSISELNSHLNKKYKQNTNQKGQERVRSKSPKVRNFCKNQRALSTNPSDALHRYNKAKKKIKQSNIQLQKLIQLASSQQMLKSNYNFAHSQYGNQVRNSIKEVKSVNNLLNTVKTKQNHCNNHQDQIRNYYCFTCVKSICVQCALHGSHVGHQVQAVKKASTKLKVVYQNIINQSDKYRSILQSNLNDIDKILEFFKTWNQQQIRLIKQKFKQLLDLLVQKQENILNQIQQNQTLGTYKLNSMKRRQQQVISQLKIHRKSLKKSLTQQPSQWNIQQIQSTKNNLKNILSKNNDSQPLNIKKMQNQILYVQTQIVMQAIDTIQQLVNSFKVSLRNKQPPKKSDEVYFYKTN